MNAIINDKTISDVLIERPISFRLRWHRLFLYQPTLGKIQLITRLWDSIATPDTSKGEGLAFRVLDAAKTKKDVCLRLLAYATLPGDDCLNERVVLKRIKLLRHMDTPDLASLVLSAVSMDYTKEIMEYRGIDKETERLSKLMKIKNKDNGSISLGGKSIWGALLDTICSRYGWSYQYVLWGISYSNLQLLLADQVKTVFLSDAERKRVGSLVEGESIKASDTEKMWNYINSRSWK